MKQDDAYSGLGYRRLIAWSQRLEREWPFLTARLADAPQRSVVDLGCGPGEHLARLASEGWRTLGIDLSPAQIAAAREAHPGLEFVQGAIEDVATHTEHRFGAALCLGNVLPSLDDASCGRMLAGLHARLLPDAVLLLQLLDFTRILAGTRRALGPQLRPPPEGAASGDETVFLRLFAPGPDPQHVHFVPVTLTLHAAGDPVIAIERAQRIVHRAWTAPELRALLVRHGFERIEVFGDLRGSPHDPELSDDLVVIARRGAVAPHPNTPREG